MAVINNSVEQLREAQARARLQQKTSGGIASIPSRMTRAVVLGTSMATAAESDLSTGERFHAEQNRAAINQQSLGLDPAVERFATNNNISPEVYQQAAAKAATLTQQMRAATTMAELQGLNQQYMAMNQELTEAGLSAEQLKTINEGRRWVWRGIEDSLPLLDCALLGSDFGIGTTMAGAIDSYAWISGMGDVESRVKNNAKLLLPPPRKFSPPENTGFVTHVMHWWDVLASSILWGAQIGLLVTLGLTNFIIMGVGSYCVYNTVFALNNPVCTDLGNGVINIIKAAIISK